MNVSIESTADHLAIDGLGRLSVVLVYELGLAGVTVQAHELFALQWMQISSTSA